VLRRSTGQVGQHVIRVRNLTIDLDRRSVMRGDIPIDLTATEFDLLTSLATQAGRVFTRAQLLDSIRGVSFESYERAVDSHIKNLRKKLEPTPGHPRYIETVYGIGYRFNDAT
jgi:DNA-binding response OmpR family regulator